MEARTGNAGAPMNRPRSLTVACRGCGRNIEQKHRDSCVMVKTWSENLGRFVAEGPYHAACQPTERSQRGNESLPNVSETSPGKP